MNLFEKIVMSILLAPLCLVVIIMLATAIIWSPVLCVDLIFSAFLLGMLALFYVGFKTIWDW
jgi:hypothetical protein